MSVKDTKPEKITPAHMPIRLAAHKRGGVDNHGEQKERVRMNNVWTTTTTTLLCVCARCGEEGLANKRSRNGEDRRESKDNQCV